MLEHQKMSSVPKLARSFDKKFDFGVGSNGIHFFENCGNVRIRAGIDLGHKAISLKIKKIKKNAMGFGGLAGSGRGCDK